MKKIASFAIIGAFVLFMFPGAVCKTYVYNGVSYTVCTSPVM